LQHRQLKERCRQEARTKKDLAKPDRNACVVPML